MYYNELEASGFLSHFVKSFWEYQTGPDDVAYTILPDGCFDLIIELKNGKMEDIFLTGVWIAPVNVTISANVTFLAIRFKLLAAEYIFRKEIKSLLNSTVTLPPDFWDIDQHSFTDLNNFASVFADRLSLSIRHLQKIDSRKLSLFELIYQDGSLTVSGISEKIHWNSRQINRYFSKQYGFPLKTLLSVIRVHASYKDIAEGRLHPGLNFFDQSHFIKEVRKFTGTSPSGLAANKNDRFLQFGITTQV